MKKKVTNVGASVRARILALSKERKEENLHLLERYAVERLLFRLSRSRYQDRFILKGAMLFLVWRGALHRITRDLDLLGFGEPSLETLKKTFAEICSMEMEDDGVRFLPRSIKAEQIRPDDEYVGVRLHIEAPIEAATLRLQVDVGFGDAVTVKPVKVNFPSLLGLPPPVLHAYPRETVIAEKFEAAVKLGMPNSRLKDYYDLWFLAKNFSFQSNKLSSAITATLKRRGTPLPVTVPTVFQAQFGSDAEKIKQWKAFWRKSIRTDATPELLDIVGFIGAFLAPIFDFPPKGEKRRFSWEPGGPWK